MTAQVAAVAKFLQEKLLLKKGDRLVLSFPPGLQFLVTFVACLLQGIIAVPVYPPNPSSFKRDMDRLGMICKVAGSTQIVTSGYFESAVTALKWKTFLTGGGKVNSNAKWVSIPESCFKAPASRDLRLSFVQLQQRDIAFLQFTSGSTGDPKGVMVTHGALAHNLKTFELQCTALVSAKGGLGGKRFTLVSWMPQYHEYA